jgi:hypothetical protein
MRNLIFNPEVWGQRGTYRRRSCFRRGRGSGGGFEDLDLARPDEDTMVLLALKEPLPLDGTVVLPRRSFPAYRNRISSTSLRPPSLAESH